MPYSTTANDTNNRFFMLCSSRYKEASFGKMPNSRFSLATKYWLFGGGWNRQLKKGLKLLADKNTDKKVTMSELYSYSHQKVLKATEGYISDGKAIRQNVCAYPQNSKLVLYGEY